VFVIAALDVKPAEVIRPPAEIVVPDDKADALIGPVKGEFKALVFVIAPLEVKPAEVIRPPAEIVLPDDKADALTGPVNAELVLPVHVRFVLDVNAAADTEPVEVIDATLSENTMPVQFVPPNVSVVAVLLSIESVLSPPIADNTPAVETIEFREPKITLAGATSCEPMYRGVVVEAVLIFAAIIEADVKVPIPAEPHDNDPGIAVVQILDPMDTIDGDAIVFPMYRLPDVEFNVVVVIPVGKILD